AGPRVGEPLEPVHGLGDCAVAVDVLEHEGIRGFSVVGHGAHPWMKPVALTADRTCASVFDASNAAGAGGLPAMSRVPAAWRASTETIDAAAARIFLVTLAPWPL